MGPDFIDRDFALRAVRWCWRQGYRNWPPEIDRLWGYYILGEAIRIPDEVQ